MTTVLFCFKGRHGLGHTRRTLLIADAVAKLDPGLRIVLISQCRSTELLRRSPFPVINLPVLERMPNDTLEAAYLSLLRALCDRLAPSLVVEDTYPDPRHIFLDPFRDIPKVLVMSGMTRGAYLERLRHEGLLRHFDRILITRAEKSVMASPDLTPATRTMLTSSARISFCGPVFARPTPEQVAAAAASHGSPLVVVNAGAGGDVTTQAFPARLFKSMTEVAARLPHVHVVLVAGPYFRGRPPPAPPNVTFLPFIPDLPALLHAAKVVVIRPGSNVLRETLSGPASTVIVPNFSWAEDQQEIAESVMASVPYVDHAGCDDVDRLHELTEAGLAHPPRPPWEEAVDPMPDRIARELLAASPGPPPNLFVMTSGLDTEERRRQLPNLHHAGDDPRILLIDRVPPVRDTPAVLFERGARLLLVPDGTAHDPRHGTNYDPDYGFDLPVWRRMYRLSEHGLLAAPVSHVRVRAGEPGGFAYRLRHARATSALPAIWLDLRAIPTARLADVGTDIRGTLADDGARLAGVPELIDRHVTDQLM